ncbi:uncharacterized protein BX664DRAFT_324524 [Halteromyces radiatus]|uniref:uncharacterized protein n=1 Tax=Halteromyces radiatus TaxID=101107 RepID=UPI00221F05B7|nr:uncharacterized protein BX664DRAFT_324524 [Halteromyces radiatus]KAI8096642.1 hypothetical protein BX664DRAFT_324524 [Halteromyces radiatus]
MRTTLFVAGFGSRTRARDLAYEFERYGRLVRCDIPAPKSFSSKPYAFVEFEDPRDAEDSFNEMHGRRIDGYTISVQWARNAPSSSWRFDRSPRRRRSPSPRGLPPHPSYGRSRSRSPYGGRSPPPPPPPSSLHHSGGYHGGHHHHHHHHHHHRGPPSPLRGRSPPPHVRDRHDRSRSPAPLGRPDDYPYPPPGGRPLSNERRSSRSQSPPPMHLRGAPLSRSPSPQRRSISPRRSRSPL